MSALGFGMSSRASMAHVAVDGAAYVIKYALNLGSIHQILGGLPQIDRMKEATESYRHS